MDRILLDQSLLCNNYCLVSEKERDNANMFCYFVFLGNIILLPPMNQQTASTGNNNANTVKGNTNQPNSQSNHYTSQTSIQQESTSNTFLLPTITQSANVFTTIPKTTITQSSIASGQLIYSALAGRVLYNPVGSGGGNSGGNGGGVGGSNNRDGTIDGQTFVANNPINTGNNTLPTLITADGQQLILNVAATGAGLNQSTPHVTTVQAPQTTLQLPNLVPNSESFNFLLNNSGNTITQVTIFKIISLLKKLIFLVQILQFITTSTSPGSNCSSLGQSSLLLTANDPTLSSNRVQVKQEFLSDSELFTSMATMHGEANKKQTTKPITFQTNMLTQANNANNQLYGKCGKKTRLTK